MLLIDMSDLCVCASAYMPGHHMKENLSCWY